MSARTVLATAGRRFSEAAHQLLEEIREVKRLVAQYGGRASKWVKKSSPQIEIEGQTIEYHWYEHSGIGRFEIKEVQIHQP
jgi:hypothetical protein